MNKAIILLIAIVFFSFQSCSQPVALKQDTSHILSSARLEELMKAPPCLESFTPNQTGPLHRAGTDENTPDDSTFRVEIIWVPSDGILIYGWLYLPLGDGKYPLVVLTNGGGDDSRPIKSLSDFIAPVFAHCGIAAFVHDKRGTGRSGGVFSETTYDDYAKDAGNCALFLSKHKNVDPGLVGVMGGSEGGRIAVLTASRYPSVRFVISFAGTVVSTQEDRLFAETGNWKDRGISDPVDSLIRPVWIHSIAAWAANDPAVHRAVDKEILEMRKKVNRSLLPVTSEEFVKMPELKASLPTWRSMPNDYLAELGHFRKKWLAIFGEADKVVPTAASVKNIIHYMSVSGNSDYTIAVIPRCGHAPVDTETHRRIRFENLIINWMNENNLMPGN